MAEFPWFLYLDGRMAIAARRSSRPRHLQDNLIGAARSSSPASVNQKLVTERNPDYWQKDAKGTQLPTSTSSPSYRSARPRSG
jgi:hypothetical protein